MRVSTDQGVSAPLTAEELTTSGSVTLDSQTEPMVSVNQSNSSNVVGMWQEDRWTTGGSRNLVLGTSVDGGRTWANIPLPGVSILAGGEFQRVTDPWVDFGPSNRVYAFSLGFDDTGPDNGLFVNTSTDGGLTWGAPVPVIIDRQFEFEPWEGILLERSHKYNLDEIETLAASSGFIVRDHEDLRPEFEKQVANWLRTGELVSRQTVVDGLENAVGAFLGLLSGANVGKMLVRLSDDDAAAS